MMSKKNKEDYEYGIETELPNALVVLPFSPAVVAPVKKPVRKITFEQFVARQKHIKKHHVAGLRAFVSNPDKLRSEEEWKTLFSNY